MGLLFNGTTQCLTLASAPVTAIPLSLAAWVNAPVLLAGSYILTIGSTITSDFSLFGTQQTDANFSAETANSTASVDTAANSSIGVPVINTLYHVCAVFTSITSRTIYVNGANAVTDVTSCTPTAGSLNNTAIAAVKSGSTTAQSFMNANVYFPAIWNLALSATDIASLAAGISPKKIHPEKLLRYARLTGHTATTEPDMMNSTGWTVVAAPPEAVNSLRIYAP